MSVMSLDLYAGMYVTEYEVAKAWCEQLLGSEAAWECPGSDAVWELAEHRYLAIELDQARAGYGLHLILVPDFDDMVGQIKARGIEPTKREWHTNGVRIAAYRDPDGNEVRFGGLYL